MSTTESDMTTEEATTSMTDESTTEGAATSMTDESTTMLTTNSSANEISVINIMKINMIMISFGTVACKLFMS